MSKTTTEPNAAAMRVATQILDSAKRTGAVRQHDPPGEFAKAVTILAAFIDAETGLPELLAACEQVIAKADEWKPSECVDGGYDSGVAHGWEGAAIILRPAVAKAKDTT